MRRLIDTGSIKPGKKAADWEFFCLVLDNCRRRNNPWYHPLDLSEEQQLKDWDMFEKYYAQKMEEQKAS